MCSEKTSWEKSVESFKIIRIVDYSNCEDTGTSASMIYSL